MEQKYAIQIKDLRKEFGSKVAVNSISLDIEKGKLFSLLGVNGAGKTTTIRMLMGLSKPTSGEAWIMGHSILSDLAAVKKISNFSPQETSVAPNLTVRENLEFFSRIYGKGKEKTYQLVDDMIEKFSLQEVAESKARTLSGGWQRKLSIAMALISEPEVLFLDEPTLGLDVIARRELWKVIEKLKEEMTIVLTTHYMEESEALSDGIAIMVGGNIKAQGTLEEIKAQTGKDSLEDAFISIAEEGTK